MHSKKIEERIKRLIKEGRGLGEGPHYQPFVTVNDFSSRGRCHRIFSEKFGRTFQLLSDIEKRAFLQLERSEEVTELYEQKPIANREVSTSVAREIGIRHPTYPGTNVPIVLTVDFLAAVQKPRGRIVVGIDTKARADAENPRTVDKLQLARACLARCGYQHFLLFDSQLPKTLSRNLEWIRAARPHADELLPYPNYLNESVDRLLGYLSGLMFSDRPLRVACDEFDQRIGQPTGTGLRAARLLLDRRLLHTDLNQPDLYNLPLRAFQLETREPVRAVVGL